jgi:hypothetical protein
MVPMMFTVAWPEAGYSLEMPKSPRAATTSPVSPCRRSSTFSGFRSRWSSTRWEPRKAPPQPSWQKRRPSHTSQQTCRGHGGDGTRTTGESGGWWLWLDKRHALTRNEMRIEAHRPINDECYGSNTDLASPPPRHTHTQRARTRETYTHTLIRSHSCSPGPGCARADARSPCSIKS